MRSIYRATVLPILGFWVCCDGGAAVDVRRSALTEAQVSAFLTACLQDVHSAASFGTNSINAVDFESRPAVHAKISEISGVAAPGADFFAELSAQVAALACQNRPREELAVLGYVLSAFTPSVTPAAIDCLLGQSTTEDMVVWNAVDAWRESGIPKTPAILALESSAVDTRTRHRLLTHQQLQQLKTDNQPDHIVIAGE